VKRRHLFAVLLAVTALVTASCSGDTASAPSTTADPLALVGIVRDDPLVVRDVVLPDVTENAAGVPFAFKARPGELLIGYFGYTSCPDVCPTTLAHLASATAELGGEADRVEVAMATVDPDRDTPERLTGYLRSFTDRGHALRTTDPAQLEEAEDAFGAQSQIVVDDNGTIDVQHSATTYVIDETGTVLVEWPFGVSAADMQHDLEILFDRENGSA
jgi:protein SCO1/2